MAQGREGARRDWAAVAAAIQAGLDELDMTQADLAARAGVAQETVRELRTNLRPRRRSPRTLTAISEALGWPAGHLASVLNGSRPKTAKPGASDDLGAISDELADVAQRLADLATRLGKLDR